MINSNFINIIKVASSNILLLVSGILTGFLLPKIMGLQDYGYYKTFTLYIAYSSIFRFGIIDGIYLRYGGVSYENLEISKFRYYTRFLMSLELLVSLILVILSVFLLKGELRFIFILVSIYIWTFNLTSYYQTISQITKRFAELSSRNTLQSLFTCIALGILCLIYYNTKTEINYRYYIIIYSSIQLVLTLWYSSTYRNISFGAINQNDFKIKDIYSLVQIGIPLLISNLCSTLLLNVDRQFVNSAFDTETYAKYAFAYNLLTLVTVCTSAISTVIYPILKRSSTDSMKNNYTNLIAIMLIFVFLCISSYFPLCSFINYFLPKYIESLSIFKIIFPGLAFTSTITVIMHNYYKTLGKNILFMYISICILILSIIGNYTAYKIWETPESISIVSVAIMFVWYIITDHLFVKIYQYAWWKIYSYIIAIFINFYIFSNLPTNYLISMTGYLSSLVLLTLLFFYDERNSILNLITKKND